VPRPTLVGTRELKLVLVSATATSTERPLFYLSHFNQLRNALQPPKMVQPIEARIQDAINYLSQNPGAKVAQVAKQFGVPRNRLHFRLKGGKPKTELKPVNKKLSEPEEQAICDYIDGLDRINFAVRAEFVTDAANYILKHQSSNCLPKKSPQ
jgi:hypothetical protein